MEDFLESALNKTLAENKINDQFFSFPEKFGVAQLVAKQDLVLSGTPLFKFCLTQIDPDLNYEEHFNAGQEILCNQSVSQVDGNLISLLKLQTTALDLLGFFSGLATQTRKFVKVCEKSRTRILDHCKSLPGYTHWYRQAMKDGGAVTHPPYLKNHFIMGERYIQVAGGLQQAVMNFRNRSNIPITVEVKNIEELKTACKLEVNHIRFKNEDRQNIKEGLHLVPENIKTEIHSSVCLKDIPEIQELGVDFINIESLTHSFHPVSFEIIFDSE